MACAVRAIAGVWRSPDASVCLSGVTTSTPGDADTWRETQQLRHARQAAARDLLLVDHADSAGHFRKLLLFFRERGDLDIRQLIQRQGGEIRQERLAELPAEPVDRCKMDRRKRRAYKTNRDIAATAGFSP